MSSHTSFETAGSAVVVRTQRVLDPAPPVSAGAPASNNWKTNRPVNGSLSVPVAGEVVYTITTGGTGLTEGVYAISLPATVGRYYSASLEVKAEGSLVGRAIPSGAYPVLHNGINLGTAAGVPATFDGTWQKITILGTIAATTTNAVNLIAYIPGALAGDVLRVRYAIVEENVDASRPAGLFFTGAQQPIISMNLSTNPNAVAAVGFQSNNTATWTVARNVAAPAGHPQGITTAASSVLNGPQSTVTLMSIYNLDTLANTGPARRIGAWFYVTAAGYQVKINSSDTPTLLSASTWTWVTGAPTPGTSYAGAFVEKASGQGNAAVGDIAYVTGVTAFSDGTVPARTLAGSVAAPQGFAAAWTGAANSSATTLWDADFSTRWQGNANVSPSELTGIAVAGLSTANAYAVQSTRWTKAGSKSARIIPSHPTNTAYAEIAPFPMTVSGTYTGIVTMHLEAPLSPAPGGVRTRTVNLLGGNTTYSNAAPNAAGDTELRVTGSITNANGRMIFFHDGVLGSGDIWVDLATLVAGTYTGPAFTGDSPGAAWDGAPNASTAQTWR